jgi:hypothetical protein
VIEKPPELIEAETIVDLCEAWSCPPSVVLEEDASNLRYLNIVARGTNEQ